MGMRVHEAGKQGAAFQVDLPSWPGSPGGPTSVIRPPAARTQVPAGRNARPSKTVPLWKTTSSVTRTLCPSCHQMPEIRSAAKIAVNACD
jgi:hypothetical protein